MGIFVRQAVQDGASLDELEPGVEAEWGRRGSTLGTLVAARQRRKDRTKRYHSFTGRSAGILLVSVLGSQAPFFVAAIPNSRANYQEKTASIVRIRTKPMASILPESHGFPHQQNMLQIPHKVLARLWPGAEVKHVQKNRWPVASFSIGMRPAKPFICFTPIPKSDQEDLTPQQLRLLKRLVREEFA